MKRRKGFTLMEMLIVVAIIATLVAIAIPVMNSYLEKARETADLANVRSAYAEVTIAALEDDKNSSYYNSTTKSYVKIVNLSQKIDDWQMDGVLQIGDVYSSDSTHWIGTPKKGGTCEVRFSVEDNRCTLIWSSSVTVLKNKQWQVVNGVVAEEPQDVVYSWWPCNTLSDYLYATNGDTQKLVFEAIDDSCPNLLKGMNEEYCAYHVGFFICDEDNKMIVDSGRLAITNSNQQISLNVNDYKGVIAGYDTNEAYNREYDGTVYEGKPIKIAVQIFKVTNMGNGSAVKLNDDEVAELEKIIHISN